MTWRDGSLAQTWIPVISTAEVKNGIPTGLSSRQCYQESRFNPDARNAHSGAIGLFQLLPEYFPGAGNDPIKDTASATAYLASLAKRFKGDWQLGLAAYDWGPGSVDKWMKDGAIFAKMPVETQDYVTQIIADVPVEGALCKTQSHPPVGSRAVPSSSAPVSAPSSVSSLLHSVTGFFTRRSVPNSQAPPQPSVSGLAPISSLIVKPEVIMSTPNPVLKAAAPSLIEAIQDIQQFFNTIGPDPAQWAVKVLPAQTVLLGQLGLLLPQAEVAEVGAGFTAANNLMSGWITKLKAL